MNASHGEPNGSSTAATAPSRVPKSNSATPSRGFVGCDDLHHCITCSDEGIAMHVVEVNDEFGSAYCIVETELNSANPAQEVLTGLIAKVALGDVLLVHAGTAIARLSPSANAVQPTATSAL